MKESSDREIGRRIAALRSERAWSQSFLASRIGMDQSVLSRVESGKRRLAAGELDLLAKALSVLPEALLPGETSAALPAGLDSPATPTPAAFSSARGSERYEMEFGPFDVSAPARRAAAFTPSEPSEEVTRAVRVFFARGADDETLAERAEASADLAEAMHEPLLDASRSLDVSESVAPESAGPEHRALMSDTAAAWSLSPAARRLPEPFAAVIADYQRLRSLSEEEMIIANASWDSVDAHGRRRPAGKPSGFVAGTNRATATRASGGTSSVSVSTVPSRTSSPCSRTPASRR
jgi:transcriptional regulator with XRE-family HTH domain